MRNVEVVTAPTFQAITLEEARQFLRLSQTEEDLVVQDCIQAAIDFIENDCQIAYAETKYKTWIDEFPESDIYLPRSPGIELVSIVYADTAGINQTLSLTNCFLDNATWPCRICLALNKYWPSTAALASGVTIQWKAGYSLRSAIPARQLAMARILITHFFEHRDLIEVLRYGERIGELPKVYERIRDSLRVISLC